MSTEPTKPDTQPQPQQGQKPRRSWRTALLGIMGVAAVCVAAGVTYRLANPPQEPPDVFLKRIFAEKPNGPVKEASDAQIEAFCGACHATPPPDSFPRSEWREQVHRAYVIFAVKGRKLPYPSWLSTVAWYENRAPESLPLLPRTVNPGPLPVRLARTDYKLIGQTESPAVANVNLASLTGGRKQELLVCDMRRGYVLAADLSGKTPQWRTLGKVSNPAHAEVVDLDQDGIRDVLVADLGVFMPADTDKGAVVLLRGTKSGKFEPISLLVGVGRIADAQAADLDGDGDLDLIVGEFGNKTGQIRYLENQTTDWSQPRFVSHQVYNMPGAIHVPITDLNGDGRPDFVTVIAQDQEMVFAFLNEGGGKFRRETLFRGPHPAYGCSGIQLVDMDSDGDRDVLLTNGDVLDPPPLLKPYETIQWLENRGTFPFVRHELTKIYGVHRAIAADMDADGDLDITAVSFLPREWFPQRESLELDSTILLEQTAPGKFVRYSLETVTADHPTSVVGDVDGNGTMDLVTGNFVLDPANVKEAITVWKNLGATRPARQVAQQQQQPRR